jgi:trehalose 6-phosphate synthase
VSGHPSSSGAPAAGERSGRTELPLVLLSHRGPVTFSRTHDGERTASRGSGGLVTALMGLAEHLEDAVWVCAADTDEDVAVTREAGGEAIRISTAPTPHVVEDSAEKAAAHGDDAHTLMVRMIETDPDAHAAFYTVVSNPILWFIQHGLYGLAESPVLTQADHDAFEYGYAAVNESFADAVADEVERHGGEALVMIHDYHFYLVADSVRKRCPGAVLQHFVHIPWPGPDAWRVLPPSMRERLLRGILGSDVVGFHTQRYARNFVACARELLGLPVDFETLTIELDGRTVRAGYYPISVDPRALDETAESDEVSRHAEQLTEQFLDDGRQLVVRVDRTDPSKNVVRGFIAFGTLLDDHPELVGKVSFLALLQPSRTDVPEYSDYIAHIGAVVAEINARHTFEGRQPIDLRLVEDFQLAVAAYSICDVLVVNALADGMNLVAKEVAVVNRRDGVLALSENTGAFEELGDYAVTLYPFDVQQQADALYTALTMPAAERREQLTSANEQVRKHDVRRWLDAQLDDLRRLLEAAQSGVADGALFSTEQ